jgi:hypothetical protein
MGGFDPTGKPGAAATEVLSISAAGAGLLGCGIDARWLMASGIFDPLLKADTPVHEYEPKTRGPRQVVEEVSLVGGRHNPTVTG